MCFQQYSVSYQGGVGTGCWQLRIQVPPTRPPPLQKMDNLMKKLDLVIDPTPTLLPSLACRFFPWMVE